jgi:hypothetical protein
MDSWLPVAIIALIALFWLDSLRARESAVRAAREACERMEVQFLDDTVALAKLRLRRDRRGRAHLARTYGFEFSIDGATRSRGHVLILGRRIETLHLERSEEWDGPDPRD